MEAGTESTDRMGDVAYCPPVVLWGKQKVVGLEADGARGGGKLGDRVRAAVAAEKALEIYKRVGATEATIMPTTALSG